jgi:hypothetical protein
MFTARRRVRASLLLLLIAATASPAHSRRKRAADEGSEPSETTLCGSSPAAERNFRACEEAIELIDEYGHADVPSTFDAIGEFAFRYCSQDYATAPHCGGKVLRSVSLPPTIRSLGRHCFDHTNLEGSVTVPDGVPEIPAEAFNSAGAHSPITATVVLPASVKAVAADAFGGAPFPCGGAASLGYPECPESHLHRDEL